MEYSPKEIEADTQVSGIPFAFGELMELRLSFSTIAKVHPVFNIYGGIIPSEHGYLGELFEQALIETINEHKQTNY